MRRGCAGRAVNGPNHAPSLLSSPPPQQKEHTPSTATTHKLVEKKENPSFSFFSTWARSRTCRRTRTRWTGTTRWPGSCRTSRARRRRTRTAGTALPARSTRASGWPTPRWGSRTTGWRWRPSGTGPGRQRARTASRAPVAERKRKRWWWVLVSKLREPVERQRLSFSPTDPIGLRPPPARRGTARPAVNAGAAALGRRPMPLGPWWAGRWGLEQAHRPGAPPEPGAKPGPCGPRLAAGVGARAVPMPRAPATGAGRRQRPPTRPRWMQRNRAPSWVVSAREAGARTPAIAGPFLGWAGGARSAMEKKSARACAGLCGAAAEAGWTLTTRSRS
jgi:hypothetical protein